MRVKVEGCALRQVDGHGARRRLEPPVTSEFSLSGDVAAARTGMQRPADANQLDAAGPARGFYAAGSRLLEADVAAPGFPGELAGHPDGADGSTAGVGCHRALNRIDLNIA
jgi:hypothetical protein